MKTKILITDIKSHGLKTDQTRKETAIKALQRCLVLLRLIDLKQRIITPETLIKAIFLKHQLLSIILIDIAIFDQD
jgi:hypothetical protein